MTLGTNVGSVMVVYGSPATMAPMMAYAPPIRICRDPNATQRHGEASGRRTDIPR